jgi:hypothetical protein
MRTLSEFYAYYSNADLLELGLFAVCGGVIVGVIVDLIMRDRGFGIIGNAFLAVLGVTIGLVLFHDRVGPLDARQSGLIAAFTTGTATLVLLFCGAAKNFLRR